MTTQNIIDYLREGTGTTAMEYPEYRQAAMEAAVKLEEMGAEIASLRAEVEQWSGMPPENLALARQVGERLFSVCCEATSIKKENARLRGVAQHCRLFIADRKGYHDSEAKERQSIIAELDDILSNVAITDTSRERAQPQPEITNHEQP